MRTTGSRPAGDESGRTTRSTDGVGDVALVPLWPHPPGHGQVAPQHPGQAAQPLAGDGVQLVGHGRGAHLAGAEPLGHLAHLGALQVADLGGHQLDGAPTAAQAQRYSAWRSRATTWVAGTGVSPRAAHTWASTAGSMLE